MIAIFVSQQLFFHLYCIALIIPIMIHQTCQQHLSFFSPFLVTLSIVVHFKPRFQSVGLATSNATQQSYAQPLMPQLE